MLSFFSTKQNTEAGGTGVLFCNADALQSYIPTLDLIIAVAYIVAHCIFHFLP